MLTKSTTEPVHSDDVTFDTAVRVVSRQLSTLDSTGAVEVSAAIKVSAASADNLYSSMKSLQTDSVGFLHVLKETLGDACPRNLAVTVQETSSPIPYIEPVTVEDQANIDKKDENKDDTPKTIQGMAIGGMAVVLM